MHLTLRKNSRLMPALVGSALLGGVAFSIGILSATGADATRSDWLGFAGAMLGAAVTVMGSVTVLEWQRASEGRERRSLLLELLDDVDDACVPFQVANELDLKERYGVSAAEQVRAVRAAIGRVHHLRETLSPSTARMMKVSDELTKLAFDDPIIETQLKSIAFYPESADFGGLNSIGHDVQGITNRAREILSGRAP